MKTTINTILFITAISLFQSCMADLRSSATKKNQITQQEINKGKEILQKAWKAQGFDKLSQHETYSYTASDTWKGFFGTVGKLWPNKKANLLVKAEIGTFDSQLMFLDGKRKGVIAGLQNWNYYEKEPNQNTAFIKPNEKITFGLSAYQYFNEMIDRLKNAPIIRYVGEREKRGSNYDLVLCTWNTEKPHKNADQYIAWVNKKTGWLEFTQYTIRDSYLKAPGAKAFYGGIEYSNFKSIEGIMIPHTHTVYINDIKKNLKKNLHQLIIKDFNFDNFNRKELKPNTQLGKSGDKKQ